MKLILIDQNGRRVDKQVFTDRRVADTAAASLSKQLTESTNSEVKVEAKELLEG